MKLFFLILFASNFAYSQSGHNISSTSQTRSKRQDAPASETIKGCEVFEGQGINDEQTAHSYDLFKIQLDKKVSPASLNLKGSRITDLETKATKEKDSSTSDFLWCMSTLVPPWPENFIEVESQDNPKIVRFLPKKYLDKNSFQVSILTIDGKTTYIVRSAPFLKNRGAGGDDTLKYYNFTIFDNEGNEINTTAAVPKDEEKPSMEKVIFNAGGYGKYCPANKVIGVMGFEKKVEVFNLAEEHLLSNTQKSGLNFEIRKEIGKMVSIK